jgi:Kdo2-lipid IVA lauroyltransferase/acyltransferase
MNNVPYRIGVFFLYVISYLPFSVIYLLSDLLYLVLYYVIGYRRNVVQKNLLKSFPEKKDVERKQIEKEYFKFLADNILETIKMLSMSVETIKKRYRVNNPEEMQKHFDKGRSVIAVTGHYGNWEWGSLILSATFKEPLIIVYKPLTDKRFEGFMNGMRSRFGAIMVAMKQTLRKIVEFRKMKFYAVLIGDQTPARVETKYFTSFLNQPTAVFLGVEKIAKITNAPVVYCTSNRIKRGYYECTFETLVEEPNNTEEYEITNLHTQYLEKRIRQRPELWLWSHKRWKYKPEEFK